MQRESDTQQKVKPVRTLGYVYLYQGEDGLSILCQTIHSTYSFQSLYTFAGGPATSHSSNRSLTSS